MSTQVLSFEENVKAKLKESIAELIPQDRLDQIVRATVAEFTTKDLPALIKAELTVQYKAALATEFAKPEWQSTWMDAQQQASPALKQLLIDAAPAVLASMLAVAAQNVMYNFQNQLQGRAY